MADAVGFFQAQRDGPDVIPTVLDRKPAHLNDRALPVYAAPRYESPDSDVIVGGLKRIGGPVDLAGGWVDAGDFIKFTHTTAYADALLFAAERAMAGAAPPTLELRGALRARLARQGLAAGAGRDDAAGRDRLGQ